jgi:hypothetical protein
VSVSRKFFSRGSAFVSSALGLVSFSIGTLNAASEVFGWPVSPILEPLIAVPRWIGNQLDWLDLRVDWAVPDWPRDLTVTLLLSYPLLARAYTMANGEEIIDTHGKLKDPASNLALYVFLLLVFLVLLSIPIVRFLALIVVIPLFFLCLFVFPFIYGDNDASSRTHFRRVGAYLWGGIMGAATTLATNYYLG